MKSQKTKSSFAFILLLTFCLLSSWAQKTTITGIIENNKFSQADLQLLYKDDGISYGKAAINANGTFKLTANISKTDLFKLVFEEGGHVMMCLSPNQNIELVLDAENLSSIKSVKGSSSLELCKTAAEMIASIKPLFDSINNALQADKDVSFYNEFLSQFKPFLDANAETDAYCFLMAKTTDSFQMYVNSKIAKEKIDPKEIDVFLYISAGFLKEIVANYTKYSSYINSMSLFYDFTNNRNNKFESFYTSSVDKYLDILAQRNENMTTTFSTFIEQIENYLHYRDSLQLNDLDTKKKEKEILVSKIIALSKMCPNIKEITDTFSSSARLAEGFGKYALQEAQRNVSNMVGKYQTLFNTENEKLNNDIIQYLLENKSDLAVLLFIDYFPKDKNVEFHKEVIKALYAKYPDQPIVVERHKVETSPTTSTAVGAMAPDLAFENPDGKIMKLSDLRGKVVLLDFWAAWCRPCRMENPNVVKVYNMYHEKGFDVFSVSLDREKASWVKAIDADGLIWPNHVSDLGYWQSQAAKIYGVSSIPATFLIGKDGRILAKNLRGAALENALKELFE